MARKVGDRILGNAELLELPTTALLVDTSGVSYRIGSHYGSKTVEVQQRYGGQTKIDQADDLPVDIIYPTDGYELKIVWLPEQ